jgi:hypothetical protein
MSGRTAAGAVLSIVSSVVANVGVNLQKKVHLELELVSASERPSMCKSWRWQLGLGGVVFGAIGDFVALGLATQALCTALGGATCLLANVVLAHFWLDEPCTKEDAWGVLLITAGAILIAVVAPVGRDYTLDELVSFFGNTPFVAFIFFTFLAIFMLVGSITNSGLYRLRKFLLQEINRPLFRQIESISLQKDMLLVRVEQLEGQVQKLLAASSYNDDVGLTNRTRTASSFSAVVDPANDDKRQRISSKLKKIKIENEAKMAEKESTEYIRWHNAFSYAACSGVVGAVSVILSSCTSKTLVLAIEGDNQ